MTARLLLTAALLAASTHGAAAQPAGDKKAPPSKAPADRLDGPPFVSAKAWAVADGKTGKVLWKRGDGSNVEPLYPVYSPVTKQCVFVGREKGGQSLYRLGADGRPERLEAEVQRDGKIASLALSPDGRYLLFCSDRAFSPSD